MLISTAVCHWSALTTTQCGVTTEKSSCQRLRLTKETWCLDSPHMKTTDLVCRNCGRLFQSVSAKRKLCSPECISKQSSMRMAATNRKHASSRMKSNNPMKRKEIREKMSATLRAMGHRPVLRGGNGKPPTAPEIKLASALGWVIGFVVVTNTFRGSGIPSHYKLDVANPSLKIAVEVDGASHQAMARKEQDRKKENWLRSTGWKVLRFSNAQVMEHLEECVQMVTSII